jgi:3-methyl-2-oxobutanoate hydroxymethyltransferase
MKESGGHTVKLEGGKKKLKSKKCNKQVFSNGTFGLTPQSIYKFGTYTVRAKEEKEADKLVEEMLNC